MTDNDPAFLWETEAIRSNPQRITEAGLDHAHTEPSTGHWVTLRNASRATGIPVETLRKWARRATIPTYLTPAQGGTNVRLVDLEGVQRRAADLGRSIQPMPAAPQQGQDAAPQPVPSAPPEVPPPPGTMIVPVDAWNKMLNQLGNLHEAGQSLAEARERAAKAETEAKFLRERLAELRQGPAPSSPPPVETPMASPAPAAPADLPAVAPEKVWHYLMRRVRDRGNT